MALSPSLSDAQKAQLNSWGPGKYDPRWNVDGLSVPVVIPPAYGLAGVDSVVFTGDGPNLSYWNRYVAVTQMGGEGVFSDPRVGSHLDPGTPGLASRSEEHTSELQSLMRISYAVFCLKKKKNIVYSTHRTIPDKS